MDDRNTLPATWPAGASVKSPAHLRVDGEPPVDGNGRTTGRQTFTVSLATEDFQQAGFLLGVPIIVEFDTPHAEVEAEITQSTVMAHITVCSFLIRRWIVAPPQLPRADRRASPRANLPKPTEVILTTIPQDDSPGAAIQSVSGELKDLSAGGMGVRLRRRAYELLGPAPQVTVSFVLPNAPGPVTLEADLIASHVEGATSVFMGFRWQQPVDPGAMTAIKSYVRTANR